MYEVTQSHLPIYFSCLIGSCTEALRVVCRSRRNTYEVTLRTLMASNTEYSLVVRWPVVAGAMAPDEVNWHLETFRIYENVLVSLQRFTPWRHRYRDYLANRVDDAEGALVGLALTPRDIYIYIYIYIYNSVCVYIYIYICTHVLGGHRDGRVAGRRDHEGVRGGAGRSSNKHTDKANITNTQQNKQQQNKQRVRGGAGVQPAGLAARLHDPLLLAAAPALVDEPRAALEPDDAAVPGLPGSGPRGFQGSGFRISTSHFVIIRSILV